MNNNETVIKLENISKVYKLYKNKKDRLKEALHPLKKKYHKDFYALKDINLEIKKGEILGIVGKNGSGKSTLLKIITKVLQQTTGTIYTKGKVVALLELGSGFNPEFTGMENIYFYSSLMGMTKKDIDVKLNEILDFADIGDFIYQPLKTYSSGMKARLAFAVSVNIDPDILILDEVLSVGDELFRRKCYGKMEEFFKSGRTILYVSHNINSVIELCTQAIFLEGGSIFIKSDPKMVTQYYQKYIYSLEINKEAVREEIRKVNIDIEKKKIITFEKEQNKEQKQKKETIEEVKSNTIKNTIGQMRPFYINNLKSKSTLITKNYDVDIYEYEILTLDGEKVNSLITGETYILSYKIKFNQDIINIVLGARIKNERGVILLGIRFNTKDAHNRYDFNTYKSDIYQVNFKFVCSFLKGTYYIDIGIEHFIDNVRNSVILAEDALIFKVDGEYNCHQWGFIHVQPSFEIIKNKYSLPNIER